MFWMLLPPSANAGRHIEDDSRPSNATWSGLLQAGWGMVMHLLAPIHR